MTHVMGQSQVLKFLGAGVLNTLFGYSLYALLSFIGLPYLIALLLATIMGVIFNYFSFGKMVFKVRGEWHMFGKFIAAYSVVYATNAVLLNMLTEQLHVSPYLGQIICIPLNVLTSWFLMNHWVYKKSISL